MSLPAQSPTTMTIVSSVSVSPTTSLLSDSSSQGIFKFFETHSAHEFAVKFHRCLTRKDQVRLVESTLADVITSKDFTPQHCQISCVLKFKHKQQQSFMKLPIIKRNIKHVCKEKNSKWKKIDLLRAWSYSYKNDQKYIQAFRNDKLWTYLTFGNYLFM